MIDFAFRVVVNALIFTFLINIIPGAHFTGSFWPDGIIYGLLLIPVAYLVNWALAAFTFLTLGIGGVLLLFCFWLIPAFELLILAHFLPQHLVFHGLFGAIVAGVVFYLLNLLPVAFASDD